MFAFILAVAVVGYLAVCVAAWALATAARTN
jgi:hypothetical protein